MESHRPAVFITGASAGIGAACVETFASAGWDVAATARRRDRLEALASALQPKAPGCRILPITCDVNTDTSVAQAFEELRQHFGRLDALVNNAGYGVYGTVSDTPLERFRENMETNFFGALRCVQAGLPLLRATAHASKRRWGASIVMVSSFVGRRGIPGLSAYCASKFALEGLSEALRVELLAERIAVSVINPGVTATDFFSVAQGRRPDSFPSPHKGMAPAAVARRILTATRRPQRNVYLTLAGKAGIAAQWISPALMDYALHRTWKSRQAGPGEDGK